MTLLWCLLVCAFVGLVDSQTPCTPGGTVTATDPWVQVGGCASGTVTYSLTCCNHLMSVVSATYGGPQCIFTCTGVSDVSGTAPITACNNVNSCTVVDVETTPFEGFDPCLFQRKPLIIRYTCTDTIAPTASCTTALTDVPVTAGDGTDNSGLLTVAQYGDPSRFDSGSQSNDAESILNFHLQNPGLSLTPEPQCLSVLGQQYTIQVKVFDTVIHPWMINADHPDFCNAEVRIVDNTPPQVQCVATTSYPFDANGNSPLVDFDDFFISVTDNCQVDPAATTTVKKMNIRRGSATGGDAGIDTAATGGAPTPAPSGQPLNCASSSNRNLDMVAITFVADTSSNEGTCTTAVSIHDETPPTVSCTSSTLTLTLQHTNPADSSTAVSTTPQTVVLDDFSTIDDNCIVTATSLTSVGADGDPSPINLASLPVGCDAVEKEFVVSAWAVDDDSNSAQCTSVVTIEDRTAPTFACTGATIELDGPVELLNGDTTLAQKNGTMAILDDGCGTPFVIGVLDHTFTCADAAIVSKNRGAGTFVLPTMDIDINIIDEWGNTNIPQTGTCAVYIQDVTPPRAVCQETHTFDLEYDLTMTLQPADLNDGSMDNCGIDNYAIINSQTVFTPGDIHQTFTATLQVETDTDFVFGTCTTEVYIDGVTLNCLDPITLTYPDRSAIEAGADFVRLPVRANNIDSQPENGGRDDLRYEVQLTPPTGASYKEVLPVDLELDTGNNTLYIPCGQPGVHDAAIILARVVEADGSVFSTDFITCVTDITVVDNTDPEAVCNSQITIELGQAGDAANTATLDLVEYGKGSLDNCPINSFAGRKSGASQFVADTLQFGCAEINRQEFQLKVFDQSGNQDTANCQVTVLDADAPQVNSCAQHTVFINNINNQGNPFGSVEATDLAITASDNCGVVGQSFGLISSSGTTQVGNRRTRLTFGCADATPQNVPAAISVSVFDRFGNQGTGLCPIVIIDDVPPTVNCNNGEEPRRVEISGTTLHVSDLINAGVTVEDNCGAGTVVSILNSNGQPVEAVPTTEGVRDLRIIATDQTGNRNPVASPLTCRVNIDFSCPEACVSSNPCQRASCIGGACRLTNVEDYSSCDTVDTNEMGECVASPNQISECIVHPVGPYHTKFFQVTLELIPEIVERQQALTDITTALQRAFAAALNFESNRVTSRQIIVTLPNPTEGIQMLQDVFIQVKNVQTLDDVQRFNEELLSAGDRVIRIVTDLLNRQAPGFSAVRDYLCVNPRTGRFGDQCTACNDNTLIQTSECIAPSICLCLSGFNQVDATTCTPKACPIGNINDLLPDNAASFDCVGTDIPHDTRCGMTCNGGFTKQPDTAGPLCRFGSILVNTVPLCVGGSGTPNNPITIRAGPCSTIAARQQCGTNTHCNCVAACTSFVCNCNNDSGFTKVSVRVSTITGERIPADISASVPDTRLVDECIDINECSSGDVCDTANTRRVCRNTIGSFECDCPENTAARSGNTQINAPINAVLVDRCLELPAIDRCQLRCRPSIQLFPGTIDCEIRINDVNGNPTYAFGSSLIFPDVDGNPSAVVEILDRPKGGFFGGKFTFSVASLNGAASLNLRVEMRVAQNTRAVPHFTQADDGSALGPFDDPIKLTWLTVTIPCNTPPQVGGTCTPGSRSANEGNCLCNTAVGLSCTGGRCGIDLQCTASNDLNGGTVNVGTCTEITAANIVGTETLISCTTGTCNLQIGTMSSNPTENAVQTVILDAILSNIQSLNTNNNGNEPKTTIIKLDNGAFLFIQSVIVGQGDTLRITTGAFLFGTKKGNLVAHGNHTKHSVQQSSAAEFSQNIDVRADGFFELDIPTTVTSDVITINSGGVFQMSAGTAVQNGAMLLGERAVFRVLDTDITFADSCTGVGIINVENAALTTTDNSATRSCSTTIGSETDTIDTASLRGCGNMGPTVLLNANLILDSASCTEERIFGTNDNNPTVALVASGNSKFTFRNFNPQDTTVTVDGQFQPNGQLQIEMESFTGVTPSAGQTYQLMTYTSINQGQGAIQDDIIIPANLAATLFALVQVGSTSLSIAFFSNVNFPAPVPPPAPTTPPTTIPPTIPPATNNNNNNNNGTGGTTPPPSVPTATVVITTPTGLVSQTTSTATDGDDGGSLGVILGVGVGVPVLICVICIVIVAVIIYMHKHNNGGSSRGASKPPAWEEYSPDDFDAEDFGGFEQYKGTRTGFAAPQSTPTGAYY